MGAGDTTLASTCYYEAISPALKRISETQITPTGSNHSFEFRRLWGFETQWKKNHPCGRKFEVRRGISIKRDAQIVWTPMEKLSSVPQRAGTQARSPKPPKRRSWLWKRSWLSLCVGIPLAMSFTLTQDTHIWIFRILNSLRGKHCLP